MFAIFQHMKEQQTQIEAEVARYQRIISSGVQPGSSIGILRTVFLATVDPELRSAVSERIAEL